MLFHKFENGNVMCYTNTYHIIPSKIVYNDSLIICKYCKLQ